MKTSNSIPAVLRRAATVAAPAIAAMVLALSAACEVDSADSASGTVSDSSGTIYDFSGTYYSVDGDGGVLVTPEQSGRAITWLRLTQYGSVLEGYDSSRQFWKGKISGVNSGNASFTLTGATTAGQSVDVAGTLRYAEGASTIDASWIESSGRSCTLNAKAAVSAPGTNTPSSSLSVSPSSAALAKGASRTFKATSGAAPYSWSLSSSSYGSLSSSSGGTVTFTASTVSGTVTLTVTDALSSSASATITVN
jgi:hypothetical protein